jgi:hypothetical protein
MRRPSLLEATDNAIILYAVGVDIAWRAIMSVLDIPPDDWEQKQDCPTRAIEAEKREEIGGYYHFHKSCGVAGV